jgi:hypothetical protein
LPVFIIWPISFYDAINFVNFSMKSSCSYESGKFSFIQQLVKKFNILLSLFIFFNRNFVFWILKIKRLKYFLLVNKLIWWTESVRHVRNSQTWVGFEQLIISYDSHVPNIVYIMLVEITIWFHVLFNKSLKIILTIINKFRK